MDDDNKKFRLVAATTQDEAVGDEELPEAKDGIVPAGQEYVLDGFWNFKCDPVEFETAGEFLGGCYLDVLIAHTPEELGNKAN